MKFVMIILVLSLCISGCNAINVVFVPSSTSYSALNDTVFEDNTYSNETLFKEVVQETASNTIYNLQSYVNQSVTFDPDYKSKFTVSILDMPVDAFGERYPIINGDVIIVLYPKYIGVYNNVSLQPGGLTYNRKYIRACYGKNTVIVHEMGHALFKLSDVYKVSKIVTPNSNNCVESKSECPLGSVCKPVNAYWCVDGPNNIMEVINKDSKFDSVSSAHIKKLLKEVKQ